MTQEIELKPSQEAGKIKIQNFLKSDHRIFRLVGPAGSGKTTMIKNALHEFLQKDNDEKGWGETPKVVGIALAHKAKNVLKKSIPNVQTFAKAFGYAEKILENGERIFEPKDYYDEPPLGHQPIPVFVHDEISMYTQQAIDIMLENTPKICKIILMGDRAQLPPPGQPEKDKDGNPIHPDSDSPVFTMELPEECQHILTERVRQTAGNPILELSDIVREEIENGRHDLSRVIQAILSPKIVDGKGYDICSEIEAMADYIKNGNYSDNKIIAYKNDTIKKLNTVVRNKVFNNPKEKLIENDIIFLTNNFRVKDPDFTLNNADEFVVQNVSKNTFVYSNYHIESYFAFIPNSQYNFPVYVCIPTVQGEKTLNAALKDLRQKAQSNRKVWGAFYRLKDCFTEFTMAYAINAYRSQGSTYKVVYFDIMDVLTCGPLTPKRMLQTIYTVITRASDRVRFIKN